MIDLDQFLADINQPMFNYTGKVQVIVGNQKIPPEHLENNRIAYNMILFANSKRRHTQIVEEEVVDFNPDYWEEEGFDNDVMTHVTFFPESTLSFTAFGSNARKNIAKLREWWYVRGLADRWLKDSNYECVIREVMEINERTTYLESDYERRYGFDVRIEFMDVVSIRERTIERLEIIGDIEKTIEI